MSDHVAPAHSRCGQVTETPYDGGPAVVTDIVRCVWCGYMWAFRPGSGARRGYCAKYNGLVCGRDWCIALGPRHWMHWIDNVEAGRNDDRPKIMVSVPNGIRFGAADGPASTLERDRPG